MSVVTTNQSKTMGQRVLQMFSDVLNAVSEELENIPRPTIRVFAVTGSTVTATSDAITLTAVEAETGIWEIKLPRYGAWTITATTPNDETYTEVIDVDDVKKYVVGLGIEVKRYGYRIKEAEPDPYERVEYILDAVGMTPAHMDFENEVFEYGSWRDVWFVSDNKPLMLKYDGTVDYYLDPNDYTLREDGETASDVSNADYEGNAMAQFPLCWIYRYEDDTYKYEIVSNVKYDENYKAYAHTRADGSIAEYFYHSLFEGTVIDTKLRSLAAQTATRNIIVADFIARALENGTDWYIGTWSRHECIRTLLVLIGKSTNAQTVYGRGNETKGVVYIEGTHKSRGQFYGSDAFDIPVKVLHIENFWGNLEGNHGGERIAGVLQYNTKMYVKMTPEGQGYRITDTTGYTDTGITLLAGNQGATGWINTMTCSEYGMFPTGFTASSSTYYADRNSNASPVNTANTLYPLVRYIATAFQQGAIGIFGLNFASRTGSNLEYQKSMLTCTQPVPQEEAENE